MAELRCPMCSKINEEEADVCAFCQARLRPLVIEPGGVEDEGGDHEVWPESDDQAEEEGEQIPGWLARIRERASTEAASEEPEEGEETAEVEGWLERLRPLGDLEGEVPEEGEQLGPSESVEEEDEDQVSPEPEEAESGLDWLEKLREADTTGDLGPPEEPTPEWLDDLAEEPPEGLLPAPGEAQPLPAETEPEEAEDLALPDQEIPDGLGEEEAIEGPELPHVQALILDGTAEETDEEGAEIRLEKIDLPSWVQDLQTPASKEEAPELTRASLPTWLESMRPIESFRPIEEGALEADEPAETVGPLAGLLGVLSAEPVIAMPRTPTAGGGMLEVSDLQIAQADVLRGILEEEQKVAAVRRPLGVGARIARWLIGLLIVVAIGVSVSLGASIFPPPSRVSRDLITFVGLVNNLPQDRPVLLVFDYEPAYAGELDAVAGAMLDHMVQRELRVVTLSTRPSGPPLAERMVSRLASANDLEWGVDYGHLGYLAGGEAAVQLFAASPREAIVRGFLLPEGFEDQSLWETPVLLGVERLSDFGMLAVITAKPENARVWAEQAPPWMGESPLAMVLSTGAAPLVRPYYETRDPRVDGILSGLPAAMAYEQINGSSNEASLRWNGFGMGVLVAEIVLVAGVIVGAIPTLLERARGRARNA